MLNSLKKKAVNVLGWRTSKKIIVFESDDWGMTRTFSKDIFDQLVSKGYPLDKSNYARNDAFESTEDLQLLINVLKENTSANNQTPKFTLNNVVFNPDFDKIFADNFTKYHREPFYETLKYYDDTKFLMETYRQGIQDGIIKPQFHCTEHVNVNRWMKALNDKNNIGIREAFGFKMASIKELDQPSTCKSAFLDAYDNDHNEEFETIEDIIAVGLNEFYNIWGFHSKSFIAPCYIWPKEIEPILSKHGIRYLQGTHAQRLGMTTSEKYKIKYHYLGQNNNSNQIYLIRNCYFEPSSNPNKDWVKSCLLDMERAFKFRKPAIICSHRINYISRLNEKNRQMGLTLLNQLLHEINKRWPDVVYMTSDELGDLITQKTNKA